MSRLRIIWYVINACQVLIATFALVMLAVTVRAENVAGVAFFGVFAGVVIADTLRTWKSPI